MNLVGTILVGPKEEYLEIALESFTRCGVDAIHALVDTIDIKSLELLRKYKCNIYEREWDWNFAASRTYISSTIPPDTKYEIFLDCDDEVPDSSANIIRDIVKSDKVGYILSPYIYTEGSEEFSVRRIRMYPPNIVWRGRCHEVPVTSIEVPTYIVDDLRIMHHFKGNEVGREDRYIEGLLLDLAEMPGDSRTLHYLGQSYYAKSDYNNAIKYYTEYMNTDGWEDERLKATLYISYSYQNIGDMENAINFANVGIDESKRARREPILRLAELMVMCNDINRALELIDIALLIPFSTNISIQLPPYSYESYPIFRKAELLKALGRNSEALSTLREGLEINKYDPWAISVYDQYVKDACSSDTKCSISNYTIPDGRLLYMYLGPAPQPWTASSINGRGVGGRETSTIYVAQELRKYGYTPIIFADCPDDEGIHEGLLHIDYRKFYDVCRSRVPDTIISSMSCTIVDEDLPECTKIMWSHDLHYGDEGHWNYLSPERRDKWDKFVFVSQYQLELNARLYNIPIEKCYVIGHGIDYSRFDKNVVKDRHKMVYTSSPDRGLEILLNCWPAIREKCPEATLHIYYGFDNMKSYGVSPDWVDMMQRKIMNLDGIRYYGRMPQDKLADGLLEASIWAYANSYQETFCISAIEAAAAGLATVTSDLAALHTTVGEYGILLTEDYNTDEYRVRFTDEVVRLLLDDEYLKYWSDRARDNAYRRVNSNGELMWRWDTVGKEWARVISDSTPTHSDSKPNIVVTDKYREDSLPKDLRSMGGFLRDIYGDKPITMAEIGVFYGDHARALLDNLNIRKLYLIDPYMRYDDYTDLVRHDMDKVREEAYRNLEKYGDRIVWIYKPSDDALDDIPELLDVVYIDGNHKKKPMIDDTTNYYRKVKPGGYIGGHDYVTTYTSESIIEGEEAVNELSHRYGPITVGVDYGTDWWFRKPYNSLITGDDIRSSRSILAQLGHSVHIDSGMIYIDSPNLSIDEMRGFLYSETGLDVEYPYSLTDEYWCKVHNTSVSVINKIDEPLLSIIVPGCSRASITTNRCIESLKRNMPDLRTELIGINDNSNDNTLDLFNDNMDIVISNDTRLGLVEVYNSGILNSNGKYILLNTDDTIVTKDIIEEMVVVLDTHNNVGIVTCGYDKFKYSGNIVDNLIYFPEPSRFHDQIVFGQAMMMRRLDLINLNLFDTLLYSSYEDHDITRTFIDNNYDVVSIIGKYGTILDADSSVINGSIVKYSIEESIRKMCAIYYFHMKWGYEMNIDVLRSRWEYQIGKVGDSKL